MKFALAIVLSLFAAVASAQTPGPAKPMAQGFDREEELAKVYEELKHAPREQEARRAVGKLWTIWLMTPDEASAELMNRAIRMTRYADYATALDQLSTIIGQHPTYAEAWNQRAHVHFLRQDWERSIADCEKVLELEPKHLGCLTGLAIIHIRQTKRFKAGRGVLERALAISKFIPERRLMDELPVR